MKLSKRCEYGLRAMIDIGVAHEHGRVWITAGELARHAKVPEAFLEQVLVDLANADFLNGRRGAQAGYELARPAEQIRMGDIVRLLDGSLAPIACAGRGNYELCSCPDEDHCGLRLLMMDVRAAVATVLDRTTLAQSVAVTLRENRNDHSSAARGGDGKSVS